jgi:Dolichyl-phosphate-mannose-protein mannosyltransferase
MQAPANSEKKNQLAEHTLLGVCALLPALYLTADRWLGLPMTMPWEAAWHASPFLAQTGLPAWALIALLSIAAVIYLFTRLPQRDAFTTAPAQSTQTVKPLSAWLLPGAAFHLTLILTLRSLATGMGALPVWVIALLLTVWLMWPHRKAILPIFWIFNTAIVLYSIGINDWRFAIVGDEYPFFLYALEILEKQSLRTILSNFFQAQVVYERFTYLSSLIQAVSMALLGKDSFGWRFGGITLAALSIPLLYDFSRAWLRERTALLFAGLIAASHFLMNFSKIGYNNIQALFMLSLLLWLGGKVLRSERDLWIILLGTTSGLCFYVYPLALVALPLPYILLLIYRPQSFRSLRTWLLLIVPWLLLLIPLFLQPTYWRTLFSASLMQSPDPRLHLSHFFANLLAAFASFFYAPTQSHFVAAAFLDPLSAALAIIGLAWTLRRARKERFARFLLLAFVILLIGAGAIHDRPLPIVPHMFLVLPCFLLFTTLGIEWLFQTLPKPKVPAFQTMLVIFGAVLLVGLNLVQAYTLNLTQADSYFEEERIFLRLMQRDAAHETINERNYLYFIAPETQLQLLYAIQQAYHLPLSPAQIIHIPIEEMPEFSPYMIHLMRDEESVAILSPGLDESLRWELERELVSHGKEPCVVQHDPLSVPVFTAFTFEKRPLLCPERGNWELDQ